MLSPPPPDEWEVGGEGSEGWMFIRKLTTKGDPRFNTFCPKASPLLPIAPVSHDPVADKLGKHLSLWPACVD